MKPAVNGIPANPSRYAANSDATSGERFANPAQRFKSVTSPFASRISVTKAKAPIVVNQYVAK